MSNAIALAVVLSVALTATFSGLTFALVLERARRLDLERVVAALQLRLDALHRVDVNPLYREALEDQQARQLRAAGDVATAIEYMNQTLRTLAPHMFDKKGKIP